MDYNTAMPMPMHRNAIDASAGTNEICKVIGRDALLAYINGLGRKLGACLIVGDGTHYNTGQIGGIKFSLHRAVFWLHKGAIPEGRVVLHTCDIHGCIQIKHLRAGTQSQNVRDIHTDKARKNRKRREAAGIIQRHLTFRIDEAHVNKARAIAAREDRTIKSIIERALDMAISTPDLDAHIAAAFKRRTVKK